MKLSEIREEVKARGFEDISETILNRWINFTYQMDICEEEDWPFLEETKEGTAPLEISDLRSVEYVRDVTQDIILTPRDRREITDHYDSDLTTTGTPTFYYRTGTSKISVFPANTAHTLFVHYFKVPHILSTEEVEEAKPYETPLLPERFHYLLVEGTVARYAARKRDSTEIAADALAAFELGMQKMREGLLNWSHQAPPNLIAIVDPGVDA